MNLDRRKLSIAFVLIYLLCGIFAAYTLFTLENNLIYDAQALTVSELSNAKPIFYKLYFGVGLVIVVGLGVFLYLLNNKGMEVIYVEKKDDKKDKNKDNQGDDSTSKSFDVASIKDALSVKSKSEEKILTDGLVQICKSLDAGVGAYYMLKKDGNKKVLQMNATYAMSLGESQRPTFEIGEGLIGQVALEQKPIIIDDIPEGYIKIVSGLGSASPTHVMVAPVKYGGNVCGVVEIASFTTFNKDQLKSVESAFEIITDKLYGKEQVKEPAEKPGAEGKEKKSKGNKEA